MSDFKRERLEYDVVNACDRLRTYMGTSAFVLPPLGSRIACFGTRDDILDLLREDKQWVDYKGVD